MEDLGPKIEVEGVWIQDRQSTFNTYVSLCPLLRITLFGGHCKIPNFPLEDDLQLFPGLLLDPVSSPLPSVSIHYLNAS